MKNKPHVIAIAEAKSKTKDLHIENEFNIPGYKTVSDLGENKCGTVIYVIKDIKAKQITTTKEASEFVCTEIPISNGGIVISCIYEVQLAPVEIMILLINY